MNGFISGREEIIFHNTLAGRDEAGCHPLNTVSGLQDALDSKVPKTYLNDLYVPAGTYTIGEGGDFATINEAFAFLNNKFSNGVVDLQLLDGTHDVETLDAPNLFCSKLRILGNATDNTLTTINCLARTRGAMLDFNAPLTLSISNVTIVDTNNTVLSAPRVLNIHNCGSVLTLENKINITVDYTDSDSTTIRVNDFAQVCMPKTDLTLTSTNLSNIGIQSFAGNINITTAVITASNFKNLIYVSSAGKVTISTTTFNETNITSRYNITINQINNTTHTAGSVIYLK